MKVAAKGDGGELRKRRALQRLLIISWGAAAADGNKKNKFYQKNLNSLLTHLQICSLFALISLLSLPYLSFFSADCGSRRLKTPLELKSLKVIRH